MKPDNLPGKGHAALTASCVALRILIVLNWVYGAAILALLIASFLRGSRIMTALGANDSLFRSMQGIALLGLFTVPLYYLVLRRLLDVVESVQTRDPFVRDNATRLQSIAWALLALQVLSLVIGGIAKFVSTTEHPLHLDAGFSTSGWLGVLLLFVLARVFAQGTQMRDELEGTI